MKKRVATIMILVLIGGLAALIGQAREPAEMQAEKKDAAKPDKKKVKELMEKKLEFSQKILAALVHNDLEKAAKYAKELQKVRKEAAWLVVKTEEYEKWSADFSTCADHIIQAEKDNNPDAAKLGYLEMTMTCFHCHTYVRDLGDIHHLGAPK